jgi:hypothetical protein
MFDQLHGTGSQGDPHQIDLHGLLTITSLAIRRLGMETFGKDWEAYPIRQLCEDLHAKAVRSTDATEVTLGCAKVACASPDFSSQSDKK